MSLVGRGFEMKAIEFHSALTSDQTLKVPAAIADSISQGQMVRVLVLFAESNSEENWEQTAATDFAAGYAESDSVYDQFLVR